MNGFLRLYILMGCGASEILVARCRYIMADGNQLKMLFIPIFQQDKIMFLKIQFKRRFFMAAKVTTTPHSYSSSPYSVYQTLIHFLPSILFTSFLPSLFPSLPIPFPCTHHPSPLLYPPPLARPPRPPPHPKAVPSRLIVFDLQT